MKWITDEKVGRSRGTLRNIRFSLFTWITVKCRKKTLKIWAHCSDLPDHFEILPLLCSSMPLFPTSSRLPTISPCSPGSIGGWPLGYEERRCWTNCPSISFQDFQPMWSWSINVTDRQTDRRHGLAINTALWTVVHRAVKNFKKNLWNTKHLAAADYNLVCEIINLDVELDILTTREFSTPHRG